ncbi:MAG: diguanylate cyclase [Desulfobacteraceae bacterium]|nr:diguanylate cyclase [Desulfobacteraceae bacterium]MCB9494761.1 diguanylate cyclase [Desulfobacteraceae bacterium]
MKNIFYLIETEAVLNKFLNAFKLLDIESRQLNPPWAEFTKLNDLAVIEDSCFDKIKNLFLKSQKKHIILIIQKTPETILTTQDNIIADFISFDESSENIAKRVKFNLSLYDMLEPIKTMHYETSQDNNQELLKLEMERKNTLFEITDKIAKELTQPLTTLICNAELLKAEGEKDSKIHKKAERIIESSHRITESVKKIQALNLEESYINRSSEKNCTNLKILCISLDKNIIKKIRQYLKSSPNTEVSEADSFESADKKMREKYFDLIFTEEKIDSYSVFGFLEKLKINYRPFFVILLKRQTKSKPYGDYKNIPFEFVQKERIKRSLVERIIFRASEKARLEKKLLEAKSRFTELPMRDEITGLYNKRWFFEVIPKEISRAKRYKSDLAVLMAEVVDYPKIRDKSGHIFLEKILSEISSVLLTSSRKSDYCCRYDNSFAVVLTNTPVKGGEIFSARIDKAMENKSLLQNENIRLKWKITQFDQFSQSDSQSIIESVIKSSDNK